MRNVFELRSFGKSIGGWHFCEKPYRTFCLTWTYLFLSTYGLWLELWFFLNFMVFHSIIGIEGFQLTLWSFSFIKFMVFIIFLLTFPLRVWSIECFAILIWNYLDLWFPSLFLLTTFVYKIFNLLATIFATNWILKLTLSMELSYVSILMVRLGSLLFLSTSRVTQHEV